MSKLTDTDGNVRLSVMNRVLKTLTEFGLSENEGKLYMEALKHEETGPFELSRKTGIPRTTVYDLLMSLSLKGLIELKQNVGMEKQQTKIRAKNPSVLRDIIRKRKQSLAALDVDVVDMLPFLREDFHKNEPNADFRFFPGIEGAREVIFRENKTSKEIPTYIWNYLMPMDAIGRREMNSGIDVELTNRARTGERVKNIIPLNNWTRHVLSYQYARDKNYIVYNEFRYIDSSIFSINQEIYMRNTSVAIACVEDNEAWGLVMYSASLTKTFVSMFEYMWATALPVTKALILSFGENDFFAEEEKRKRKK